MLILLLSLMGLTLLVLITGLVVMIKGGKTNKKWGNRLMVLRVVAQGLVVALLGVIFLMKR